MAREPAQKPIEMDPVISAPELVADDLADIDPAEFFDPEEFGYRRPNARLFKPPRP